MSLFHIKFPFNNDLVWRKIRAASSFDGQESTPIVFHTQSDSIKIINSILSN